MSDVGCQMSDVRGHPGEIRPRETEAKAGFTGWNSLRLRPPVKQKRFNWVNISSQYHLPELPQWNEKKMVSRGRRDRDVRHQGSPRWNTLCSWLHQFHRMKTKLLKISSAIKLKSWVLCFFFVIGDTGIVIRDEPVSRQGRQGLFVGLSWFSVQTKPRYAVIFGIGSMTICP